MPHSSAARRHDPASLQLDPPSAAAISDTLPKAAVALRAFFRLADAWQLGADEQRTLLGRPARTTFYRWRKGETGGVTVDTMERLSHLLAIYAALHSIYLDRARADSWVRRPNDDALFDDRAPLDRLLIGRVADIYEVRRYVEAAAQPAL
jgi:hypothetical protein